MPYLSPCFPPMLDLVLLNIRIANRIIFAILFRAQAMCTLSIPLSLVNIFSRTLWRPPPGDGVGSQKARTPGFTTEGDKTECKSV